MPTSSATQPTVLLYHHCGPQSHFDWMIQSPVAEEPTIDIDDPLLLWTWRSDHPTQHWHALSEWTLTQLPPHRLSYLTYQGPVHRGLGGSVQQRDRGTVQFNYISDDLLYLDITMVHYQGPLTLKRQTDQTWLATPAPRNAPRK